MKNISEIISKVLYSEPYIEFVYLFGSVAKGNIHPLSDYDIAVYIDPKKLPAVPYGIKSHVSALFVGQLTSQKMHIVILNEATSLLAFEVVSKGQLIFEKNERAHHSFVFNSYRRYFDMKRFYEFQAEGLLKRVKNGTYGG